MRLLQLKDNGAFSLTEYVGKSIPPYAILSHTWGQDHEEVTFKDLIEGTGEGKDGYRKLTFCGKQAAKDGLLYFWVDTCCIDKSSSTELSEAITSMFKWYHKADKCYIYLSDVSTSENIVDRLSFQNSRWFTRGWTLQELLAPTSVEFFSSDGTSIGNKISLMQEIHNATGIPTQALQGTPLSFFGIDERLSWAEGRQTKREEDAAYSLLGIFDVQMSLFYGEGRERAFSRLRRKIEKSSKERSLIFIPQPQTLVEQQGRISMPSPVMPSTVELASARQSELITHIDSLKRRKTLHNLEQASESRLFTSDSTKLEFDAAKIPVRTSDRKKNGMRKSGIEDQYVRDALELFARTHLSDGPVKEAGDRTDDAGGAPSHTGKFTSQFEMNQNGTSAHLNAVLSFLQQQGATEDYVKG
jgi:hypothetical protein